MISKKHKINLALSLLFASAASICVMKAIYEDNHYQKVNSTDYQLVLSDGVDVQDDLAVITNDRGSSFELKFSYYEKGDGTLGALTSTGEILNYTAFHSISSISINLDSGELDFYTGWRQYSNSDIEYSTDPFQQLEETGVTYIDLNDVKPSYFKFVATSNTYIRSLTINYGCTENTTVGSLRLRIDAPTVGGSAEVADSNYVWVNTNIADKTAQDWPKYLMNKDTDGSWYYDFTDIAVSSSGYSMKFWVSDSDVEITSWESDYSSGSDINFGIGESQTEFNVTGINFDSQPAAFTGEYYLNLTLYLDGDGANFGNIQFVYNYSNSTSEYTKWIPIDDTWSEEYYTVIDGLDPSRTLYFRIYMWAHGENCYVGTNDGEDNFSIVPSGSDINATVSFVYNQSTLIEGYLEVEGGGSSSTSIYHDDISLSVYEKSTILPSFDADEESFYPTYSGNNISIIEDDGSYIITGVKAGTVTPVTLHSNSGLECTFNVTVASSTYNANWDLAYCGGSQPISTTEGWFTSTTVSEINNMGSDFYNGIDASSFKALIDSGSHFFNASGVEQHLFYILKDAGVNWIRLKLWVDPQSSDGTVQYGGGNSTLVNTIWMAKEAKAAGLKFLLDFHYSDYWTHPGQQILPKSWNDCGSKSALLARIKSYTTNTLTSFSNANCLPDMVQLGNEISSGIFLQKYTGGDETLDAYGQPSYLTGKSSYAYGTSDTSQFTDYIKAASEGVDAVDSSIKKVLHWAKGSSISAATINSFFNNMPSAYYDYAAISFYPYYCFDTLSRAQTILNGLSLSKPWFVAETSYPFSGGGYVYYNNTDYTSFSVSNWSTIVNYPDSLKDGQIYGIRNSYAFNSAGQANMIHDLTASVVNAGGKGIFYWESAWIPNLAVGWAGIGSLNTWGNQGFFSFDGKAIANLDLFAQMSPHI